MCIAGARYVTLQSWFAASLRPTPANTVDPIRCQPVASCQDAREGGFVASCERARLLTWALAAGPALLVVIVRSWSGQGLDLALGGGGIDQGVGPGQRCLGRPQVRSNCRVGASPQRRAIPVITNPVRVLAGRRSAYPAATPRRRIRCAGRRINSTVVPVRAARVPRGWRRRACEQHRRPRCSR